MRDTYLTATALLFYDIGLVFSCIAIILQGVFYAYQDTFTPLCISAVASLLNIIFTLILMKWFGLGGIALATSIIAIINTFYLLRLLKSKIGYLGGYRIFRSFLKITLSSIVMAIGIWYIPYHFDTLFRSYNTIVEMGTCIFIGIVIYFTACKLFKVNEFKMTLNFIRNRISF
jgi:putative peptidoglycan lipid II flippase